MPRKHIVVSGRVQGVGFRYRTQLLAVESHLTGWVRNLDSGDVELEIQGSWIAVEKFLLQLGRKSSFVRIDHMEVEDCREIEEKGFKIRY